VAYACLALLSDGVRGEIFCGIQEGLGEGEGAAVRTAFAES
jgi:hypothetical protein